MHLKRVEERQCKIQLAERTRLAPSSDYIRLKRKGRGRGHCHAKSLFQARPQPILRPSLQTQSHHLLPGRPSAHIIRHRCKKSLPLIPFPLPPWSRDLCASDAAALVRAGDKLTRKKGKRRRRKEEGDWDYGLRAGSPFQVLRQSGSPQAHGLDQGRYGD